MFFHWTAHAKFNKIHFAESLARVNNKNLQICIETFVMVIVHRPCEWVVKHYINQKKTIESIADEEIHFILFIRHIFLSSYFHFWNEIPSWKCMIPCPSSKRNFWFKIQLRKRFQKKRRNTQNFNGSLKNHIWPFQRRIWNLFEHICGCHTKQPVIVLSLSLSLKLRLKKLLFQIIPIDKIVSLLYIFRRFFLLISFILFSVVYQRCS